MKMVKSLLLSSAAGVMAVAGAQAADLPVKAKPVEYVKICSLYGDGFYYIPGSNTCLRFAGTIRAEIGHAANGSWDPGVFGPVGLHTRESEDLLWKSRAQLDFETRAQTEYGTLRSFGRFAIDSTDGGAIGTEASTSPAVRRAFIQWAGFTFGRVRSLRDSTALGEEGAGEGLPILTRGGFFHGSTSSGGINEVSYSWELGNGMSLHAGGTERNGPNVTNLSATPWAIPGTDPTSSVAAQVTPNPFVAFKVSQSWGKWEVSAAAQSDRALYYTAATPGFDACTGGSTGTTFCDYPGDKWGFNVSQALIIKTDWINPGDRVGVYASYNNGFMAASIGNNSRSAGLYGSGNQLALGAKTDAVYVNGSGVELTTAFSINGGYAHVWSPQLTSVLWGAFWKVSYNDTVIDSRWFCGGGGGGAGGIGVAADVTCDPGYTMSAVGFHTIWTPTASSFTMGVEVLYARVGTAFKGETITLAKNGTRPGGAYLADDEGTVSAIFRVQRTWPGAD